MSFSKNHDSDEYAPSRPIGISPLIIKLAEDLIWHGHEVQVATVFPHGTIDPQYRSKQCTREKWGGAKFLYSFERWSYSFWL